MREIDDEYNRTQDPTSTTSLTKQDPIIPITPLNPLQNTLKLQSILEEAEIENTPMVDGGESTSANKDSSKMSVSIQ
jgi:hypothetical protein